nr:glycosyltransferase [Actinomycetota bacterium]
ALRRADALRALSPYTAQLAEREAGVPPLESFPAFSDLSAFTRQPVTALPETPTALFVGTLERSKNIAGLVRAWPHVAARVPEARLVLLGRGALLELVERLRDDYPGSVEHIPQVAPDEVAALMDASTCLVLPSRSEGFGRVVVESYTRGRGVIASRVGSLPDLVEDGVTGLLVDDADVEGLAEAITVVLSDPGLAERLGRNAEAASARYRLSPDDYAARVRTLVDRTLAGA